MQSQRDIINVDMRLTAGNALDQRIAHLLNLPSRAYSTNLHAAQYLLNYVRRRERDTSSDEPFFWRITDMIDQWLVELVWAHHDGDIPYSSHASESLELAICGAILDLYRTKEEQR